MKCDGCTLCCKLLPVPWMDSLAGEYCRECDEGVGCKIYDHAPKDCLSFRCSYNQMEKCHIDLRPDNCGVVFERIGDDIFIGTTDPILKKLKDVVGGQIRIFAKQGFSVILFNKKIQVPYVFPSNNYTKEEVWNKYLEREK
jgi:hypothetical protein